nr:MAG TPA: hypothetical protein [Caudoviricetes sp.]
MLRGGIGIESNYTWQWRSGYRRFDRYCRSRTERRNILWS